MNSGQPLRRSNAEESAILARFHDRLAPFWIEWGGGELLVVTAAKLVPQ